MKTTKTLVEKTMKKSNLHIGLLIVAVVMVVENSYSSPAPPPPVPDGGASSLLLSLALGGLAVVRKYVR